MTKSELRRSYLGKRRSLSSDERIEKSDAIADRFFSSFDLTKISCFHCFIPIAKFNEVETLRIIGKIWKEFPHVTTVVPRVDFTSNTMTSVVFRPDTKLARNAWDIDEPIHDEFVEADQIDMILVPAVCFDVAGHRVGYGKGFYDRFLATCRRDCVKIGLSFWGPVERIDDVYGGDVAVDLVITPMSVTRGERDAETR